MIRDLKVFLFICAALFHFAACMHHHVCTTQSSKSKAFPPARERGVRRLQIVLRGGASAQHYIHPCDLVKPRLRFVRSRSSSLSSPPRTHGTTHGPHSALPLTRVTRMSMKGHPHDTDTYTNRARDRVAPAGRRHLLSAGAPQRDDHQQRDRRGAGALDTTK